MSMDFLNLKDQLEILNEGTDWLHYDVIDGHFAPGMTVGPALMKPFVKGSQLPIDVHLMVNEPDKFIPGFIDGGAYSISFHYEQYNCLDKCEETINFVKEKGVKAGLAINPATEVSTIEPLLNKVDLVLVMAVVPGYRDSYMKEAIEKVNVLDQYRKQHDLHYLIQVDGGVNGDNLGPLLENGCDSVVAGGFIFKGDMQTNIATMRRIEQEVNR